MDATGSGRPGVERVRLALLVPASVGQLDERAAVPLVEPARAFVALERPQVEAVRPLALHDVEEHRSDTPALRSRVDVQVAEQIFVERGEAEHFSVDVCHPDLVAGNHDVASPAPVLLVRVDSREEVEASEGRDEDLRDGVGVGVTRGPCKHDA